MQVGEADFFWEANGRNQFPDAAAQVEAEVQKYKQVWGRMLMSQDHDCAVECSHVMSCG